LLEARLGGDNRPSERERQSFLVDEEQWRTALKYMQNWFKKEGRDEAVAGLGELLERLGRRLSEIRTHLGG